MCDTPMLSDTSSGLSPRAPLRRTAAPRSSSAIRAAAGHEHREPIAADAGDQSAFAAAPAHQGRDGLDDLVADMHAVILVDDVELVDVDVEQPVRARAAGLRSQLDRRLCHEGGLREHAGDRVEARANDLRGFARHQFERRGVAELEILFGIDAENREHADDPPRLVAYRRRNRLVGHRGIRVVQGQLVRNQSAAVQLRAGHEMPVHLREQRALRGGRLALAGAAERHVAGRQENGGNRPG